MSEIGTLVLTRKIGESVIIGTDVTVTVSHFRRGHVVLSITAPKTIPVDRAEIRKRKDNGEPPPRPQA